VAWLFETLAMVLAVGIAVGWAPTRRLLARVGI
jgi:hypothetical protein